MPTTTVASSEANSRTVSPTSWNSPMDSFGPPVTFTRIPRAPARSTSSSSGLRRAFSAAIRARSSPLAVPDPIMATPISAMTVRTSAKSTLIRPGRVIRSAIPDTALCNTSSAALKASSRLIFLPSTASSRSLGTVISESTCLARSAMPSRATCMRLAPSKEKGRVTTATVRMPSSRATCATTGAAPVPVPPPMPAVMNNMSAPRITSWMRSRSSMAAWRPTSGLAPAPRPFVMVGPSCSRVRAPVLASTWASVLAAMNSTPSTPARTILATALPPPPPTPMTLITAFSVTLSTISNMVCLLIARNAHSDPLKQPATSARQKLL